MDQQARQQGGPRLACRANRPASSVEIVDEVGDRVDDSRGEEGVALGLIARSHPGEHQDRLEACLEATMSVSMRSPIIAVVSEWASMAFSAERIMSGLGL